MSFLRKQESKIAVCEAVMPWKKGFRFPSPYRRTENGKLHGNDGEARLFWEIHRSFAKVSFRRNDDKSASSEMPRVVMHGLPSRGSLWKCHWVGS